MTADEARQVLEDAERKRLEEFQAKLQALLEEYNVTLQVTQQIIVTPNAH